MSPRTTTPPTTPPAIAPACVEFPIPPLEVGIEVIVVVVVVVVVREASEGVDVVDAASEVVSEDVELMVEVVDLDEVVLELTCELSGFSKN